jgi:hypothetical protein
MPENEVFVATIYAPITYYPAPVLVYKEIEDGKFFYFINYYSNLFFK